METTEIGEPQYCGECIFQEINGSFSVCRFYPKYRNLPYPTGHSSIMKPAFCRIKKILVYEDPLKETWGGFDNR